jgi:tryptophan synthase alpha chain
VSSRLVGAFRRAAAARRAALVVFVESGDPSLEVTERLVPALASAGADVIELGIPFSDPIADGPAIQRASERALRAGSGLAETLELVARLRSAGLATPIVLFSYANPILAFGEAEFAHRAALAGVNGVLVTDLPPEEGRPFASILRSARLAPIYLVAPTSPPERIRRAAGLSRGFLYLVSRAGVTGVRETVAEGLADLVARVRESARKLPIAVGFGISTPDQVRDVARLAEGVVVGSALVTRIELAAAEGRDPVESAAELVRELAAATAR